MQTTDLGDRSLPAARALTRHDYKTLSLAALGGALEFYDFIIFVFFAPVIGQLFFPATIPEWLRQLQTFGIFAAGYLARPLGGIVMAHFGDLLGRKRMFTLSVLLMSVPTLLMGLLATYASVRMLAAEIPLKAVLRDHGRAVIVSMLLTWMLSAAIVVVILMTPTLLQKQFHIAPATALIANCLATLCLTVGCVPAGAIAAGSARAR